MNHHDCMQAFCGVKCCNNWWKIAFGLFLGAGIIVMIALLALSIKDVDFDEVAVAYNKVSREFNSEVLREGRHTVDPADELITFSNKVNTKHAKIECVSSNGLIVYLTVSTQFRVNSDQLFDALYDWKNQGGLFNFLDYPIEDATRDACAEFSGKDYFQKREQVEQDLTQNISSILRLGNNRVTPNFVQLKNIGLPTEFLSAIQGVQSELENVQVELAKRDGVLINAQTELNTAKQDAAITILKAEAESQGIRELAIQKSSARTILWEERLASVKFGLQSLSMSPKDYAEQVLFPQLVAQSTSSVIQACLQSCTEASCWYCWVGNNANIAVAASSGEI